MNYCDIQILKSYSILTLYSEIFFRHTIFDKKKKYQLFKKLFKYLENFEKKIKIRNDEIVESLLFSSACFAFSNRRKRRNY